MQKEAMQEEAEFLKIKEKEIAQQVAAEPISFVDEANDRKKKKNILSYMLDDKLFLKKDLKKEEFESESESESESEIKYGLEEATKLKEGYGIGDSAHIVKPSQTEKKTLDYNFTENSIYYDQICESKSESIKTENISTEQAD
ncbi:MAG: hypothetical protein ACTTH0_03700, partial [Eubacteriales bacterium]